MSNDRTIAVLAAFDSALTADDYNKAKLKAAGLSIVEQFVLVDAARAARERLQGQGVRL